VNGYIDLPEPEPEHVTSVSRSKVRLVAPAGRVLISSAQWEVTCLIDSADPGDAEYIPPSEEISRILHSIPGAATRLTIRFARRES
jgi:hypothetical protein